MPTFERWLPVKLRMSFAGLGYSLNPGFKFCSIPTFNSSVILIIYSPLSMFQPSTTA
jgi:hypothetical protein